MTRPELGTRAVCYCRDCQAFARFLGPPDGMMDAMEGTEIVAVRPHFVTLTQGQDHLACVSLSPKGTLRWYTRCCKTPIGNTPRSIGVPHVGLIHTCLEGSGPSLESSFGAVRMRVNTQSARGKPPPNSVTTFASAMVRFMTSMAWARLSGRYRTNPFFGAESGQPLVPAHVVSAHMRARLRGDA